MNIKVRVVRVFTDQNGHFGNPVGIVIDEGREVSTEKRQATAVQVGFSETVFVNEVNPANVSIFSQQKEVPFAGHALVGTAWLIDKITGRRIDFITCQGKEIKVVRDEGLVWVITGDLSILPPWNLEQLDSEGDIEALSPTTLPHREHSFVWAWLDQSLEIASVRARTFLPDWGIAEDEANGSGSMLLASKLGRSLLIKHGKGSYIRATSGSAGVAVGGLCREDPTLII